MDDAEVEYSAVGEVKVEILLALLVVLAAWLVFINTRIGFSIWVHVEIAQCPQNKHEHDQGPTDLVQR